MSVLALKEVYFSVGQFPLLDYVNFSIEQGERIALIGRNGEGKSTLMRIIAGIIDSESGSIEHDSSTKIAYLDQNLPSDESKTVYEFVATGLQALSDLLMHYHNLTTQTDDHDETWLNDLNNTQQKIEQMGGWDVHQRIEKAMAELKLPADTKLKELSGGWRRKVALAQCFVQQPDILLLDEPTNHLDLEAILWLENRLLNYPNAILFITHDRALLKKICTSIVELDRGHLTQYPKDYDEYLKRKDAALTEEQRHNELFDKKLADEEKWIRQGIKARRTRNEGRVRALKALREERAQRREQRKNPDFGAYEIKKQGKTVIQAENISFEYQPGKSLVKDFSFTIQRGDKIAIVGPNGAGKTTLVKLLLEKLKPSQGVVKHSPTNKIAFFDQTRQGLNPDDTLIDNVAEGDDFVETNGKRKHIIGYLGEFLFPPKKCHTKVGTLSGGEQNRLMLAKLFSKPANVFVLDEPTNDLDIETLELLESILLGMQSTVILISHDRAFIDNIATYTIAFEDNGDISIHVGGYSDWLESKKVISKPKASESKAKQTKGDASTSKKLSYNEQRELKSLPEKIEKLENQVQAIHQEMNAADFYQRDQDDIKKVNSKLSQAQKELEAAYQRWEELE